MPKENHHRTSWIGAWAAAWRGRKAHDGARHQRHELEFRAAALEVQDSPPNPAARAIGGSIMVFFVIAVVWAAVGEVDIVAVAHGKIIPSGRSKVIQPLEIGVVRAIHVHEGQLVKQGDPLLDLDSTTAQADQTRLRNELMANQAALARIQALLKAVADDADAADAYFIAPAQVDPAIQTVQQALLRSQFQEHQSRVATLASEISKKTAELAAIREEITKLKQVVPLISQRVQALKTLRDKRLVSDNDYLTLEQERVEQVQDLAVLRARRAETAEAIEQAKAQRQSAESEFESRLYSERAEVEVRISALSQELIKAKTRTGLQKLRAPVDGVVQQLAVHTIGGVVTPAQALMIIVPDEHALEVEAFVQNKDIGFVREGQPAEIKIDAFPFTKYGVIDGRIVDVSNDAVENEAFGWVFGSRLQLASNTIQVEGRPVNLTPGMSVAVEVKTGKRRLIEYFLSPLLRYRDESVGER